MGHSRRPQWLATEDGIAEQQTGTDEHRGRMSAAARVEQRQLQSVLGKCAVHAVAPICSLEAVEEVRWCGDSDLKAQGDEHNCLQVEDLFLRVCVGSDVRQLMHFGWA